MKRIVSLVSAFFLIFSLFACAKKPDCLVADVITEVSVEMLNPQGYALILRTTGFSEKEHFYELFASKPTFDDCGKSALTPVFQVHVDDTQGAPVKLLILEKKMQLMYSANAKEKVALGKIPVEIQGPLKLSSD